MPFEPLVTAAIETTLNTLIQDDPELVRRLSRLKGQVIQVHLKEFNKTLTFIFSQQIDVLAAYEGESNCYLSLNVSILPELREQANITQLIKQDKLVLEGDIQLAQKFAQLITDCKPDVEEWLSRLTGDVLAHALVQGVKDIGQALQSQRSKHQNHLSQVLTEEWRLLPSSLEVAYFCDQVDDLNSQAARIEAKIQHLLEQA
ncbi:MULTISPECIES: ubiquinone biosynthesis accessory factor UbiJ [Vibrio]|jgi:ubiquinone biosynthesis accessory factor UbiJ|uniref:Ubiquinone biosynthesis accessory factor UbiJ n=1 Tax=Vibrio anguillarum TaxID=55601 RepID=A0A241P767_VIBAN|nr:MULTISPECIES: SCP2 domain-containing protein [Vibrio]ASG01056.1 SCP2 domain-containing protein [Vibrio anguillarum]ASG08647.1 SCP2 domain-containing protein [Vibrio anguillarum]ATC58858.1 SCP2 domain-containing protein [Vibrio anguillarum]MBF4244773.1 SCP2 domain-containing protein [Vibrio anguillarum]MBF4251990.1 SCP2 domain-containing protein [Vibrio anguillarum]